MEEIQVEQVPFLSGMSSAHFEQLIQAGWMDGGPCLVRKHQVSSMETPLKTSMKAEGLPPLHKEKHRQEPLIFGGSYGSFGGV